MGHSKKGQGYIQNYFYVVEGSFANTKIGRASFGKQLERGGFFKENRKGQGVLGKTALLLPLSHGQNRGGGGAPAAPGRRPSGHSGGREEGKRERGARGFDSPSYFERRRPVEVARRRRAAVGSGLHSSGAVGEGSGRAVAGVVVVVVGDVGGPFIGRAEQGGGGKWLSVFTAKLAQGYP